MTSCNVGDMKAMMLLAHKLKCKSLTLPGGFHVVFGVEDKLSAKSDTMPTEDELLYWSTNYEPDIKAEPPE